MWRFKVTWLSSYFTYSAFHAQALQTASDCSWRSKSTLALPLDDSAPTPVRPLKHTGSKESTFRVLLSAPILPMEFAICKSKTWVLLLYFHECSTAITKLLSQDPRQYLLTRKLKVCILTAQVSSTRQEQIKVVQSKQKCAFQPMAWLFWQQPVCRFGWSHRLQGCTLKMVQNAFTYEHCKKLTSH